MLFIYIYKKTNIKRNILTKDRAEDLSARRYFLSLRTMDQRAARKNKDSQKLRM